MTQQAADPLGRDVAVTHILVVADPARSRGFWTGVLGAEVYREYGGTSVVLRLAAPGCSWSAAAGRRPASPRWPSPPDDAGRVSHAMTLRVADCQAAYEAPVAEAAFLTPPHD